MQAQNRLSEWRQRIRRWLPLLVAWLLALLRKLQSRPPGEDEAPGEPQPGQDGRVFTIVLREASSPGETPLAHFAARVELINLVGASTALLFEGRSDAQGKLRFAVASVTQTSGVFRTRPRVKLRVFGLDGESLREQSLRLDPMEPEVTVTVELAAYRDAVAVPLVEWERALGRPIPEKLHTQFKDMGIATMEDIRSNADSLRSLDDLAKEDEEVRDQLIAHAFLQVLTRDVATNQTLITAGIRDIASIALLSSEAFVERVQGKKIDKNTALYLHQLAFQKFEFVKNIALEDRVNQANGFNAAQAKGQTIANGSDATQAEGQITTKSKSRSQNSNDTRPCDCGCKSAVSPLAYLADLLDFVLREVRYNNAQLTGDQLEKVFHQDFLRLPTDCANSERLVRQVRICIEVLGQASNENTELEFISPAISEHPRPAYDALLAGLGTSSRELRSLRGATDAQRERRAAMLGIAKERLDSLILSDPSDGDIEQVFGYQDIWSGSSVSSAQPKLLQWRLEYLEQLWKEEDNRPSQWDKQWPIVDPDILSEDFFLRPLPSNTTHRLYGNRRLQLSKERDRIDKYRDRDKERDFHTMLKFVRLPPDEDWWKSIEKQLGSTEATEVQQGIDALKAFYLAPDRFIFLNEVRKNPAVAFSPAGDPEMEQRRKQLRSDVIDILLDVKKRRDFYPTWLQQERKVTFSPAFFCLPARLPDPPPSLRFVEAQRNRWVEELTRALRMPFIDPDVWHLVGGILHGDSIDLMTERESKLSDIFKGVQELLAKDKVKLDKVLGTTNLARNRTPVIHALGLEKLDQLQADFDNNPLTIQPEQHGLTRGELIELLNVRKLVTSGHADPEHWHSVYHILVQAEKRRFIYPQWRAEEKLRNVRLTPQVFVDPDLLSSLPPVRDDRPEEHRRWRSNPEALREMQSTVRARYRQQAALAESLRDVVDRAEQATLPALRDALIDTLYNDPSGIRREENKVKATNALLINTQDDGVRKTTRVAQAIESMQLLVWGILNGQLEDRDFTIPKQEEEAFSGAWKWFQSYATWRSTMFVYMYPDNYLSPRLRPEAERTPLFDAILLILDGYVPPDPPDDSVASSGANSGAQSSRERQVDDLARILLRKYLNNLVPASAEGIKALSENQNWMRVWARDYGYTVQMGGGGITIFILLAPERTPVEDDFYLPLHYANILHDRGEYVAALEWYKRLYDWQNHKTVGSGWPLLGTGSSQDNQVYNAETWLTDSLNPHLLARTRGDAYERSILVSIIRCHLDFAEAEFSADNPESLARARELYLTAQRLLEHIGQTAPDCDRLPIEVGEHSKEELAGWVILPDTATKAEATIREMADGLLANPKLFGWTLALGPGPSLAKRAQPLIVEKPIPGVLFSFCIPRNPILIGLQLRTVTGLYKLNNSMNLAGMRREVAVYAAPTDASSGMPVLGSDGTIIMPSLLRLQGTQYRYKVLVERAKLLVNIAQQVESSYLSFLEKFDQESYTILRARHDLGLANGNVMLQGLRVTEAENGIILSDRQYDRVYEAFAHYVELTIYGWSIWERWAYGLLITAGVFQSVGALAGGVGGIIGGAAANTPGAAAGAIVGAVGGMIATAGGGLATFSSVLSMYASFERRQQEWEFQRDLAQKDLRVAEVQQALAKNRRDIVKQEQTIAQLSADNAADVLNFLGNKFTNADLYSWMSGVVGNVYRYFLEQATSIAKLAQMQLAFERQEAGLVYILSDYWSVSSGNSAARRSDSADRRGMTGSARLLQDVYRMDQHAFTTDRRKLQMSKTISLAMHDPIVFQQFKESGVLPFTTTLALFDRDFPGHYLRLIKRVRTTVIALIPPTQGIKATLASTGISHVVISTESGALFDPREIPREPETVALTSPANDSGVFELQEQPEMLLPFEGLGVAGSWVFRLPKPANAFDFGSIADVLVTIEYTALDSPTYRLDVIKDLDNTVSADRPFSFRHQFADAWYDLHHPDLAQKPMEVSFATRREDFPPNVTDLKIEHVTLYIARKSGITVEFDLDLKFVSLGSTGKIGGKVMTSGGSASTDQNNAGSWMTMIGKSPTGEWTLAFEVKEEIKELFANDQIEDILFVITFGGETPAWPV